MPRCGDTATHVLNGREYMIRLPAHSACEAGLVLPLLILIHCYGGDAQSEINKALEAADRLGFVLAAPEGRGNSFNSPSCCGPARDENVDDVSFVDAIVADMVGGSGGVPISRRAVFASGFSNGGFLTSHLASAARARLAAISTQAGHEYDVARTEPLPVYMHHCSLDTMVRPAGCCRLAGTPSSTCCCGIGLARPADQCVSVASLHTTWMRINRCASSREEPGPDGSHCVVGVDCAANTTLCMHPGCYHQQWSRRFRAASAVLEFFAREACTQHGGTPTAAGSAESAWDCSCPRGRSGWLCLGERLMRPTSQALMVEGHREQTGGGGNALPAPARHRHWLPRPRRRRGR